MRMFLLNCKTQDAADRLRDHPFLVRPNDAHGDPTGLRGNHALIRRVSLFFECDSKKLQPLADPGANIGAFSPMPPANTNVSSPIRSMVPSRIRRSESPASNSAT